MSMSPDVFCNALVLTGPTASGKSALGLEVAKRLGAEIVSMDSMALYRGMDIGTAKPTREQRAQVPHHLLDLLDPWDSASVAWWIQRAAAICQDIEARGRRVLFVGGTPLYLKVLLLGLFQGPPADAEVRTRLEAESEQRGARALHDRLNRHDPLTAARLHRNDVRRVIRALEVWELTGRPMSEWQVQWSRNHVSQSVPCSAKSASGQTWPRVLWLDLPRAELYARIDARVTFMLQAGLRAETEALRRLPRPLGQGASQALGYKEMLEHLEHGTTLEETVRRIQTRTRNFAKRQLTWFRRLPGCFPTTRELTIMHWRRTMD